MKTFENQSSGYKWTANEEQQAYQNKIKPYFIVKSNEEKKTLGILLISLPQKLIG